MKAMLTENQGSNEEHRMWLEITDGKGGRDEIFVDVVERLTCTFNATGTMSQAQASGALRQG
eukprot:scaffold14188_cov22-Tisochrysis_lutea.AAC.2